MPKGVESYIGLGSNLNQPAEQIKKARIAIGDLDGTWETGFSSLYKSRPMGLKEQPDYLNAVIAIETELPSLTLLDELQSIEAMQGRVRNGDRWDARTLDLDILLYGDQVIENERLVVPHYGIADRSFVLYPLDEIAPGLIIPGAGSLSELIKQCGPCGLVKLN